MVLAGAVGVAGADRSRQGVQEIGVSLDTVTVTRRATSFLEMRWPDADTTKTAQGRTDREASPEHNLGGHSLAYRPATGRRGFLAVGLQTGRGRRVGVASLLREFRIATSRPQEALAERCRMSQAMMAALEQVRCQASRVSAVALIADSLSCRLLTGRGWPRPPGSQAHPPGFPSAWVVRWPGWAEAPCR